MKKLRVRWKEPTLEAFIERRGADLSGQRAFLQTSHALEPGTEVRFEFILAGDPFLAGTATVEAAPATERRPGMVLRYEELSPESLPFVERLEQLDHELPTREVTGLDLLAGTTQDHDLLGEEPDEDTFPDAQPAGYRAGRKK